MRKILFIVLIFISTQAFSENILDQYNREFEAESRQRDTESRQRDAERRRESSSQSPINYDTNGTASDGVQRFDEYRGNRQMYENTYGDPIERYGY